MQFNRIILALVVTIVVVGWSFQAQAVVNFTKDPRNPVFLKGGNGAFDEATVERPSVIKDGSTYKMWYMGADASGVLKIGYATSPDGIVWTRGNSGNPVLSIGSTGDWDSAHVGVPWVIKEGGIYKMWFTGTDDLNGEGNLQTGYATSPDGINWTKYNNPATSASPFANSDPVLPKGNSGADWDGTGVFGPTVINDDGTYKMWYVGFDTALQSWGIGHAFSPDGIVWTKSGYPVLSLGPQGSWDAESFSPPTVFKEDSLYRMWYGASETDGPGRIGYAYSLNGVTWRKYHGNPIVMEGSQTTDDFDEFSAYDPMVVKDGNVYKLWYTGEKDCHSVGDDWVCTAAVGYAESPVYPGSYAAINRMQVHSWNNLSAHGGNSGISVAVVPEGPGPLDITEIKVEGPNGFSHTFSDNNIQNNFGSQSFKANLSGPAENGTYTFTLKTNNGLTAVNSLNFTYAAIPDLVDGTDSGQLDRQINDGPAQQVYAGGTTPTFKWKPSAGESYYYRVFVQNWESTANYYQSDMLLGSTKDANGYLSATVPGGVLPPDAPMQWRVQAIDTNDLWTAHNRSVSNWFGFYTGVKDELASPDFIAGASMRSERSFRAGDRAIMMLDVINLAPWDIDETDGNFSVLNEGGGSTFYNFVPVDHADTSPGTFDYFSSIPGIAPNATSTGYVFKVRAITTLFFENQTDTFQDQILPQVSRKDMLLPADNAYLLTNPPTFSWVSQGSGVRYRVRVRDWHSAYPPYISPILPGLSAGQTMSVTPPADVLKEGSPYHWEVEVSDAGNNSRTRSQRLSFMIVGTLSISKGDINANGSVNITDAILALQALIGLDPAGVHLEADVDGDGKIGVAEVIYILQVLGGKRTP